MSSETLAGAFKAMGKPTDNPWQTFTASTIGYAACMLLVFFHQNTFIVEKAAENQQSRQERRAGAVPTYSQRTKLILLSTEDIIRRQYQVREDSDVTSEILARAPHCRRAHWRHFRAERYSAEKREKPTWVKAHWVGSDEWQEGQVRYKVRLDL